MELHWDQQHISQKCNTHILPIPPKPVSIWTAEQKSISNYLNISPWPSTEQITEYIRNKPMTVLRLANKR